MNVYDRLLSYVSVKTPCGENTDIVPTTDCQFNLANQLVGELKALGVENARVNEKCFVYGIIPATEGYENKKKIGFIAHMDTVPEFCEGEIHPICTPNYNGEDLVLGTSGRILSVKEFPHLKDMKGRTLITSDGNTILGVDDKAGIAEIMQMVQMLKEENIPHGQISIAFTPDEECGSGSAHFDLDEFGAEVAYTLDGDGEGQIQYENFNACCAKFEFEGVSVHPGSAKNIMVNAVLLASDVNRLLPEYETPAHTEKYEGFYHLLNINGDECHAISEYIIRDHDEHSFICRKNTLRHIEKIMNEKYGEGTVKLTIEEEYKNMESIVRNHMYLVENAKKACENAGVPIDVSPIRGGTDGCKLSFRGLPCPNLGTGGHGYHGPMEHTTIEGMEMALKALVELVKIFANE